MIFPKHQQQSGDSDTLRNSSVAANKNSLLLDSNQRRATANNITSKESDRY